MKNPLFYLILLLTLCLQSCITYIDRELDVKPKLVLFCYIVPQLDTTIVRLTNSVPLFTSNPKHWEYVTHATVEISDNNIDWVKFNFQPYHKYYLLTQTDFPIREGKTYYIRASAPEYETVYANCTVPVFRETNVSVVLQQDTVTDKYGNRFSLGKIEWTDYAGEDNYYIFCDKTFYERYEREWDWEEHDWIILDTIYSYGWHPLSEPNYRRRCVYSDKDKDGKKMTAPIEVHWGSSNWSEVTLLEITQLQTDIHCYQFEISFQNYEADLQFFMLEPMQLYSNIKNGYGLFGAFVLRDYGFEFE